MIGFVLKLRRAVCEVGVIKFIGTLLNFNTLAQLIHPFTRKTGDQDRPSIGKKHLPTQSWRPPKPPPVTTRS